MGVLISDQVTGWRDDTAIARAAINFLQTISFKFRRGVLNVRWWKRAVPSPDRVPAFKITRRLIFIYGSSAQM